MPSPRRPSPRPKATSARPKRAPRRKGRGRGKPRRGGLGLRARLLVAVGCVGALLFFAPVRAGAGEVLRALGDAVAEARREHARERVVRQYAQRYGIGRDLADAIERNARAEGVDVELAFRLVRVESAFREDAVSPVGALGLTQLMPATADEMQPGITRAEILHRETNLRLGFRYLRYLLEVYEGDREEALHAYNRGMGTVARIRARGGDPANGYARHVLGERGASPVRRPRPASGAQDSVAYPEPPLHELPPAFLSGDP